MGLSQLTGDGGAGTVVYFRVHRTFVFVIFFYRGQSVSTDFPVVFTTQPLPREAGLCRLPEAAQDPLMGEQVPGPPSGESSGCSAPPRPFGTTLPSALSGAGLGSWGGRWGECPPEPQPMRPAEGRGPFSARARPLLDRMALGCSGKCGPLAGWREWLVFLLRL